MSEKTFATVAEKYPSPDILREMLDTFSGDTEAQFGIGNRAYELGIYSKEEADYMNVAIEAYKEVLKHWNYESEPMHYTLTQNNLGMAYIALADINNKEENCHQAIDALQEALNCIKNFQEFPTKYASIQGNLGSAYRTLSEIENQEQNCQNAIQAYKEALEIFTREEFPAEYATTKCRLGNVYQTLAETYQQQNKQAESIGNCQKAIQFYNQADEVLKHEGFFPNYQYAHILNGLGSAYKLLTELGENKASNCHKAVSYYKKCLEIYNPDFSPIYYADVQTNISSTYRLLAEIENQSKNCRFAIEASLQAIKIYKQQNSIVNYAIAQSTLAAAYGMLAYIEDKGKYCELFAEAYKEAEEAFRREFGERPSIKQQLEERHGDNLKFCQDYAQES